VNREQSHSITRVRSVSHLVPKEALAALAAVVVAGLISAVFDAPLQGPADPQGIVVDDVKAPWIFVGIQQLLRFLPPLISGIIIPLGALLFISLVPYLPRSEPVQHKTVTTLFFGTIIISLAFTIWGYLS
jgi:quinol-cytochrome oxidoreductase complex cytochrome b subunit